MDLATTLVSLSTPEYREVPFEEIFQVYEGRTGCSCGCRGTYYCASAYGAEEGSEYNPEKVREISRIVASHPRTRRLESPSGEQILVLDLTYSQTYSVYFSPDADLSAFPEVRN